MKKYVNGKGQKGITLIVLVITIIVLLILAAVSFNVLLGENGLITKASDAKNVWKMAKFKEEVILHIVDIRLQAMEEDEDFTMYYLEEKLRDSRKYDEVIDNGEETLKVKRDGMEAIVHSDFSVTVEGMPIGNKEQPDTTPPVGIASYNPEGITNGNVIVTITTNEPIQDILNGWEKVDSTHFTREYTMNVTEEVKIYDLAGNEGSVIVDVTNIEKAEPTGMASYSPDTYTMGSVTVTITTNKEINTPDGWTYVTNQEFTKVYTENKAEVVTITDTLSNTGSVSVNVTNILVASAVNAPKIVTGMTPVKWNGTDWVDTTKTDPDWYYYVAHPGTVDGRISHWANARTTDGSFWVWIPRYEYKIDATGVGTDYTKAGTIDVNFIATTKTTPTSGYTIHPAFTNDINNGGWNSELSGIWVAKYEMSMETDGKTTKTSDHTIGNVATSSSIKAVSKPGVSCWGNINIANMYNNSYNYDRAKESHMMKNSEWGCAAYLTHSKYGRNGTEVTINNNGDTTLYTGGGAGTAYKTNGNQSSTGNPTGIYDLNGNAYEYVAGYNKAYSRTGYLFGGAGGNTEESYKPASGSHFAYSANGASTKYLTAYSNSTNTNSDDFTAGDVSHIGDGIHEVYVSSNTGWFSDHSYFIRSDRPFFIRGGHCNYGETAGVFYSNTYYRSWWQLLQFSCSVGALTLILTKTNEEVF